MAADHALYYLVYFFLLLVPTAFLLRFFQVIMRSKPSSTSSPRLPPSPPSLPVIGHLHLIFFTSPLAISLTKLSSKYGSLLHLRLGASRMLLVSSASSATEVFKTQDLDFADRPSFAFAEKFPFGNYGFFGAEYGDYWRFMKKLCMTELFSARQLQLSRAVRRHEIRRFLRKVSNSAEKMEAVDLGVEFINLTNNSFCRTAMSTSCTDDKEENNNKMRDLIKKTVELAVKVSFGDVLVGPLKSLGFWLFGRQMIDVIMKYDAILEKILKEHEERGRTEGLEREDRDLMDIILKFNEDGKAEMNITRTHIKAFFLDLFIGGTNTSSEVMQWAMAELINRPDVFKKLREEIELVVGTNRLIDESDIPNLPYLEAVVKETLRLYPAVPLAMRKTRRNCTVQGFDIQQGTTVAINLLAIMRDSELWENPNEFLPDRFLSLVSSNYDQLLDQAKELSFCPFGGGRRRCPGSSLALSLIPTTIGAMVQCFDWKVVPLDGRDNNKVNMKIGGGIGLPLAHPLMCLPFNVRFNAF